MTDSLAKIFNSYSPGLQGNGDKNTVHSYIDRFYETQLAPYRKNKIKFLEIGVAQGYSLAMWLEYFGEKSEVYGIDINEYTLFRKDLYQYRTIGDSTQALPWKDWDDFDVIIDDGDHRVDSQIATAKVWLPKVKEKGMYIIEDVRSDDANKIVAAFPEYKGNIRDYTKLKNRHDDVIVDFRL